MQPCVVLYATTNAGKLGEARACFELAGTAHGLQFEVRGVGVEVTEPQGAAGEIARAKLLAAHAELLANQPGFMSGVDWLVAEDAGLGLDALGGTFPGAYVKPMMQALLPKGGAAALADMCAKLGEDGATAMCSVAARRVGPGDNEPLVHCGTLRGRIVAPRGAGTHGGALSWSPVFVPDGQDGRSMGELSLEAQAHFSHRRQAIQALVDRIAAGGAGTAENPF